MGAIGKRMQAWLTYCRLLWYGIYFPLRVDRRAQNKMKWNGKKRREYYLNNVVLGLVDWQANRGGELKTFQTNSFEYAHGNTAHTQSNMLPSCIFVHFLSEHILVNNARVNIASLSIGHTDSLYNLDFRIAFDWIQACINIGEFLVLDADAYKPNAETLHCNVVVIKGKFK